MGGFYDDDLVSSIDSKLRNMGVRHRHRDRSETRMLAINIINSPQVAVETMRAYNSWVQETFADDAYSVLNLMSLADQGLTRTSKRSSEPFSDSPTTCFTSFDELNVSAFAENEGQPDEITEFASMAVSLSLPQCIRKRE